MAEMNIILDRDIKAVLLGPTYTLTNSSIILDPLSDSYSSYGPLVHYDIKIVEYIGIENPIILHNGKNSRFSCSGKGKVVLELTVEDNQGNTAKDTLTITVN